MKNRNPFLILAGVLNLFTAFVHLIGGQIDLVVPLCESNMTQQAIAEWWGVWHVITIVLFLSSFYLLIKGFNRDKITNTETIQWIGVLYLLFSVPFIISSFRMNLLAPQWILLAPIGILVFLGLKKLKV